MSQKTCHWKNCKTVIEVREIFPGNSIFITAGWCDFHKEVIKIEQTILKKFKWGEHPSKSEYRNIRKQAVRLIQSLQ